MKIKVLHYFGGLAYLAVAATITVLVDLDLWLTTILLLLVPAVLLLWRMRVSWRLLGVVSISALATTFLFESIAYGSGLWYELSVFDTRILGVFPVEIIFWNFSLQLLVVGIHEYFNDDRLVYKPQLDLKKIWLLGFMLALTAVGVVFATMLSKAVLAMAIWWLVAGAVISLAGSMVLAHNTSWQIVKKALITTALVFPVVFIQEIVALINFHWVFANPAQYLVTFSIVGELFPVDMIVLLLTMVIWLVVVYECYLDDGQ